jgi:hypothetical protein
MTVSTTVVGVTGFGQRVQGARQLGASFLSDVHAEHLHAPVERCCHAACMRTRRANPALAGRARSQVMHALLKIKMKRRFLCDTIRYGGLRK